jgi:hypothetical protein
MPHPIPGARFIACLLGGASLFGGAAALADAGRIGLTQFVAVPTVVPGGEPIDAASIEPTLLEPEVTAPAAEPDAGAPASALASATGTGEEVAEGEQLLAAIPEPRLRPEADSDVGGG